MSACIAERFATVSRSDSPLLCEETAMFRLMTSAESRLAAISKVVRVRVDGSKNRLKTLFPRSSGTFFTSRSVTPAKDSAVSRICVRISRGRPSMESRCCSSPFALSCGLFTLLLQGELEPAFFAALKAQAHARRDIDLRAAMLRANRQLPATAVGEDDQGNARRPAVVEELVHCSAHRAAAVEHVVDQQQLAAVDVEGDLGALGVMVQALRVVVVAVEGNVHEAKRLRQLEKRVQPLRHPCAARVNADHGGLRANMRSKLRRELLAELVDLRQLGQSIAPGSTARPPSRRRFF